MTVSLNLIFSPVNTTTKNEGDRLDVDISGCRYSEIWDALAAPSRPPREKSHLRSRSIAFSRRKNSEMTFSSGTIASNRTDDTSNKWHALCLTIIDVSCINGRHSTASSWIVEIGNFEMLATSLVKSCGGPSCRIIVSASSRLTVDWKLVNQSPQRKWFPCESKKMLAKVVKFRP